MFIWSGLYFVAHGEGLGFVLSPPIDLELMLPDLLADILESWTLLRSFSRGILREQVAILLRGFLTMLAGELNSYRTVLRRLDLSTLCEVKGCWPMAGLSANCKSSVILLAFDMCDGRFSTCLLTLGVNSS